LINSFDYGTVWETVIKCEYCYKELRLAGEPLRLAGEPLRLAGEPLRLAGEPLRLAGW
jgi:hypothetical protein